MHATAHPPTPKRGRGSGGCPKGAKGQECIPHLVLLTGRAGGTRTPDLQLRRLLLYPTELQPHIKTIHEIGKFCNLPVWIFAGGVADIFPVTSRARATSHAHLPSQPPSPNTASHRGNRGGAAAGVDSPSPAGSGSPMTATPNPIHPQNNATIWLNSMLKK